MNQLHNYLKISKLPCAIFSAHHCQVLNYQYLKNSINIEQIFKENKSNKLLTLLSDQTKRLVIVQLHLKNTHYLIGPVALNSNPLGQEIDFRSNQLISIRNLHVPFLSYDELYGKIQLILYLAHRYYRYKKLRRQFKHRKSSAFELVNDAYVRVSNHGAHINYAFEQELNRAIVSADASSIKKSLASLYQSGRIGVLSDKGPLRNILNFGIIAISTNIRVALRHGMDFEIAYSLNDRYVYYLEKQETFNDVVNCIENELIDLSSQIQKYRVLQASPAVVRAYHELLTNPCANETMKEIAARVNMSQNYFSSLFKKEIGVSFSQFKMLSKINRALTLLAATDKTIFDIGNELGFSDQAYFTNTFKRYTGTTPNQFREDPLLLQDWSIQKFMN